jgi:hypothetical protein
MASKYSSVLGRRGKLIPPRVICKVPELKKGVPNPRRKIKSQGGKSRRGLVEIRDETIERI